MYEIKGTIKGLKPLLFNRPLSGVEVPSGKKLTPEQIREVSPKKLHRNSAGDIVITEDMFHSNILAGCTFAGLKQRGNKSLYGFIKGAVRVEGALSLGKKTHDRLLETNIIKKDKQAGMMIYSVYPLIEEGWQADFVLLVGDDSIESEKIRIAIEHGGMFVGVGAWRPKYGIFKLEKFKKL